jgi:signal transduction histidine kinase
MKHLVGWRGLRLAVERTESVVAQQLVAAKRGGFLQHSWDWPMTGHVTRMNSETS